LVGDAGRTPNSHQDTVKVTTNLIGNNWRQGRACPLSLAGGALQNRHFASRWHPHSHALKRTEPGALDIVGNADADESAVCPGRPLPRAKGFIVGEQQRFLLCFWIIAAVVNKWLAVTIQQTYRVWHLLGLNEVAASYLGAIESKLVRNTVKQALHREYRLRPASAAHRRRRHFVGENDDCF